MSRPRFLVVIDADRCKACKLCIEFCPRDVLALAEELNALGHHPAYAARPEDCIGCQACVLMCPEVAIELYARPAEPQEVEAQ
ncbi:MAG: ferredoxin family protein [Armatimonadetes bacterium]|nr:ferredoxin family protein [Armatimonadota bacterium]